LISGGDLKMAVSKEEIKKNIIDQLFWDARVDASEITVEFSDNMVVLSGTTPTYLSKQAAEQDTKAVPGVSSVRNEISVRFPKGVIIPSDYEIKNNITNVLTWDPNIDCSDIMVSVEKGEVVLDGSVPAYWQKAHAEELAVNVNGVTFLHNRLSVVPSKHFVDELIARDITSAFDRTMDLGSSDKFVGKKPRKTIK
jgi:hyperosmotically inducible protein